MGGDGPPDFGALTPPDEVVRGNRTRDDFFDAVLGLDEPAPASEVAELAGRGVDAAREYLEWFERLGVVTQVSETPATYRRNQEYLNWRRVQQIRHQYSPDELVMFWKTKLSVKKPTASGLTLSPLRTYRSRHARLRQDSQCRTCGKTCPPGKRHVGVSHCLSVR